LGDGTDWQDGVQERHWQKPSKLHFLRLKGGTNYCQVDFRSEGILLGSGLKRYTNTIELGMVESWSKS
jgi:hypothetical protein